MTAAQHEPTEPGAAMGADAASAALAEKLRAAVGRFVRATKARADALPASRTETLGQLRRLGPQPMAALAAARGVSHQTVSRMVGELERAGLVRREPNPADARGFLIALSADGERALDAELASRAEHIGRAIDATLSRRDREALSRLPGILDRLSAELSGAAPASASASADED